MSLASGQPNDLFTQLGCDEAMGLAGPTVGVGFSGVETMTALCRKTL